MMRQETTAEVRLDANKAERFNVSAHSTGGFVRLLPTRSAICRCPRRPKGRSWPRNEPESGECGLNQNKGEGAMPATVASRQAQRYRSAFVAVVIALLGMGIAGSASSADPGAATDRPRTASPIKHVIVVICEHQR